jgi:hypothetical protein
MLNDIFPRNFVLGIVVWCNTVETDCISMTRAYKQILTFLLGFRRHPHRSRPIPRRLWLNDGGTMDKLRSLRGIRIHETQRRVYIVPSGSDYTVTLDNLLQCVRGRIYQQQVRECVNSPGSTYLAKWKRARSRVIAAVRWFNPRHRQLDRTRCRLCHVRSTIGLVECRCEYVFCTRHRLPHVHGCRIDAHWVQTEKIRRENPRIETDRISDRC